MGRIRWINHEGVHWNIGNGIRPAAVDRCPSDSTGAGVIEIGRLPNMFPGDGIAIKNHIGGVHVVRVNNSARNVFAGHACRGHVDQRVTTGHRRKHLHAVCGRTCELPIV